MGRILVLAIVLQVLLGQVVADTLPDELWSPRLVDSLVAQDNALEHLVMVPREVEVLPERRAYWEAKMVRIWSDLAAGKGSPADRLFKKLDLPLKSPGKGARWVGKNGRLIPVPAHPVGLVTSDLMSWSTKFRMFMEPFQPVRPADPEEGLSEFIARRAGRGRRR